MVVLEMRFLAGRYHATPWGRNVNEGVPEWPPSPFRLARALMDIWKRRFPDWPDKQIFPVLDLLVKPVRYALPEATAGHTRSYLHSNSKVSDSGQLILDAFIVLDRQRSIFMGFDGDLTAPERDCLRQLLTEINYFGRSESWVEMALSDRLPTEWNTVPGRAGNNDGHRTERVACLTPPGEYETNYRQPSATGRGGKKLKPPMTWIEALGLSTKDLLNDGWSDPPALRWVDYLVPAFVTPKVRTRTSRRVFRYARYALSSPVLPRVEDTAPFAERIRKKLMGMHKRLLNGDASRVSPCFSGKTAKGLPLKGHRHAFFLPLDEDRDGRLDHLLIASAAPFDTTELAALDALTSIWQQGGRPDVHLILVALSEEAPSRAATKWVSATPFVTVRHHRKGRGSYEDWLQAEIRRECAYHDLPAPLSVEWLTAAEASRSIRWLDFHRSRKGETPMPGVGCILTFSEPIRGPFALGAVCHFGLGTFMPAPEFLREPQAPTKNP